MENNNEKANELYTKTFGGETEWNRWYINNVFDSADMHTAYVEGTLGAMLLTPEYTFRFRGTETPMWYLCGAATAIPFRGKGLMTELITKTLNDAHSNGVTFMSLIPATDRLYFYYDRFGFATVFYLDCERYTSLHLFTMDAKYRPCAPTYDALAALERLRDNTVLHSEKEYSDIIEDIEIDNGVIKAVSDADDGHIAAIAFATPTRDEVVVKELLSENEQAAESVLAEVRASFPDRPFVVWAAPSGRKARLRARGMMRLTNVEEALSILASVSPSTDQVIRVHDDIVPDNNGVYILRGGRCTHTDSTIRRLTLDVTVSTLTSILFSSEKIGDIFGIRTSHAMLPLMLD